MVHRDHRAHRASLFDNYDSIEEGGIRASSSYPRDLDERDNDKAVDSLQDRVSFLKKVSSAIFHLSSFRLFSILLPLFVLDHILR